MQVKRSENRVLTIVRPYSTIVELREADRMLLEQLKAEKARRGLSHREFAALLGVPSSTWSNAAIGVRPLNNRIVRGALKAFPELAPAAVSFLLTDSTKGNQRSTSVDAPARDLAEVSG
jgi:transcriptional regulator with XRE-family HTH domain